MLAQTQASRVATYFAPFLDRFPTPEALARASVTEVLSAWSGLGYNRRAIRLKQLAELLVRKHHGAVPSTLTDLRSLPGVGPTISAAVVAQAFGAQLLPLDVNVRRLLRRALDPCASEARLLELGSLLAGKTDPWRLVQASFDFGALVCRASPRCTTCPLFQSCAWHQDGPDPAPARRPQSVFEGSHRQVRGRIVALLATGETRPEMIQARLGIELTRFTKAWEELCEEGFVPSRQPALSERSSPVAPQR
jgi:A/G-specific adenine glycosylase